MDKSSKATTTTHINTAVEFEAAINGAKMQRQKYVEITPELFDHFKLLGMHNGGDYFIYKNIMTCRVGDTARIEEKLNMQHGQIMHGKLEGRVEGVTA